MANGNPFYVQPAIASQGAQHGLATLGQAIGARLAADQQAEQKAAMQQELLNVIESDDIMAQRDFLAANPQYAQQLMGAIQFQNEATRKNLVDSSIRILQGEDPQEVIRDRAAFVSRMGGNPAETLDSLSDTPEESIRNARFLVAAYGTPQQAEAVSEGKPITPFQQADLDIKRETLNLRKKEDETRRLEQKLKEEDNALKREKLQLEIDKKRQELDQSKVDIESEVRSGIDTIDKSLSSIDRAIDHPGLESATGLGSSFPTLPGSPAANFESLLETIQSQQFLTSVKQMRGMGALSENEGKKLAAAAGSLSLSMSDDELKKELQRIRDTLSKAKRTMVGRLPDEEEQQDTPPSVVNWSDL